MKLIPEKREDVTIEWLTGKVFPEDGYEIKGVEFKGSVGVGLGMLSSMERLTITYTHAGESHLNTLNVVMKTLPTDSGTRDFITREGLAHREFQMYDKVFPAWNTFMESQNVPEESRFRHPQCYYRAEAGEGKEYQMVLLLEDLDRQEFSMWNPGFTKELGKSETLAVLTQLALFHAVGIAYQEIAMQGKETYPQRFSYIGKEAVCKKSVIKFLKDGAEKALEEIVEVDKENAPEGLKHDLEQLGSLSQVCSLPVALYSPRHSTILHHDLHANNVMFRDANLPGEREAVLIDFQCCAYSNPMKDVSFFLFLSCDSRYYMDKRELHEILTFYRSVLNKTLKQMGSRVEYSLEEMKTDFAKFSALTIIHILMGSLSWCFGKSTNDNTRLRLRDAMYHTYNTLGSLRNCFIPFHLRPIGKPSLIPLPSQDKFTFIRQNYSRSLMLRENFKDQSYENHLTLDIECSPNLKTKEVPILFSILSTVYQMESTVGQFVKQIRDFWESSAVTMVLITLSFLSWVIGSNTNLILSSSSSLVPSLNHNALLRSIYQRLLGYKPHFPTIIISHSNNRDRRFNDESSCDTPMLCSLPSAG